MFPDFMAILKSFYLMSQVYVFENGIYVPEHESKANRNYLMNAYIKQLYKAPEERKNIFHSE